MLTSVRELYSSTLANNRKLKTLPHECRICRVPAEYSHFGVISCHSCKMFFKRNAKCEKKAFICDFGGQCEINITKRHICGSCRLAKCFECGMSTDKFRLSRTIKPKTNALVKVQVQHQPERLPTLNLLQSDQSLLTKSQWTLLSNLFNSYKESKLLSIGQRLIDTHNTLQSTNLTYQALVQEFSASVYETAGAYLRFNDDFCKLPYNDRSILLRSAADNVTCMTATFAMHHCHLLALDAFSNAVTTMYDKRTIDNHRWIMKFIDSDIVLIKLAFSLFALCEGTYSYSSNVSTDFTNPITILQIQNKYAEVTWKYLLYKYGHYQAVKRFLNLTCLLGATAISMSHAHSVLRHVNNIDSLIEQTELTLILDDIDQITEMK